LQKGQKRSNEASEEAELDLPPSSVLKKYKGDPKVMANDMVTYDII